MAVDALITPLLRVPLFQGLSPLQLARLAKNAERIIFKSGDVIVREGAPGDAAYLIVSGEVVRCEGPTSHADAADEIVPPQSLIGELAMLVETEHTSTVQTRSQVRALKFTRSAIAELMQADATLAEHFLAKLVARLTRMADELRQIDGGLANAASPARSRPAGVPPAVDTGIGLR